MTIYAYLLRMQISIKYGKRKLTWVTLAFPLILAIYFFPLFKKVVIIFFLSS